MKKKNDFITYYVETLNYKIKNMTMSMLKVNNIRNVVFENLIPKRDKGNFFLNQSI